MMAANWSNIKTTINSTFQELRKEVHFQISQEIKRPYPAYPKVNNKPWAGQQSDSSTKSKN